MATKRPYFRLTQEHYERLHAADPDLSHRELWRRAEQAAASDLARDGTLGADTQAEAADADVAVVSRRAAVGLALVSAATALATVIDAVWVVDTNTVQQLGVREDLAEVGFTVGDLVLWLALVAIVLGSVALGVLEAAQAQIRRSNGALKGSGLVRVGLVLAVIGIVEMGFFILPAFDPG
jgi:hypothetical protein